MGEQTPSELSTINNAAKLSTDVAVMSERVANMVGLLTEMKRSLESVISRNEYEQFKKTNDAFHSVTSEKLLNIERVQSKLHDEITAQFDRVDEQFKKSGEDRAGLQSSLKVWFTVGAFVVTTITGLFFWALNYFL